MKPEFVISCPIDTYSGYGARSRDVVKAIIETNKYNVKIMPQRWGNTPWNFIKDHKEWHFLQSHLLPQGAPLKSRPKIWAQITVPNEFQPVGEYNIGITAGIETTVAAAPWIEGMNRMNLNLVSSQHAKDVFLNSKFEQREQQTDRLIKTIEVTKPIEVLFEGVNLETYFPHKSNFNLDQIEENFAYLFVGHWMNGKIGEDRKNVGLLVQSFYETFKNKKKTPALILKTSIAGASYKSREEIIRRINSIKSTIPNAKTLPNVYLLHGEISDKEMNELYNHKKIKAMVSLTKGEGYGRPLAEFSITKKPIITTKWSGHLDFLNPEFTTLIHGDLKQVDKSAAVKDVILPESSWFSPSVGEFQYYLKDCFENYKEYKEKGTRQAYHIKSEFSYQKMFEKLNALLTNAIPDFPTTVKLELPKLDLPKLDLPKKEPANA